MNKKEVAIAVVISTASVVSGLLFKKGLSAKDTSNVIKTVADTAKKEPAKMFCGVPISELDALAKKIYHGISCTIDQWGFLVFNHKSNRGHQTFHTQLHINDNGILENLGGHYPGQWWSTADEFAKQANELFKFKK